MEGQVMERINGRLTNNYMEINGGPYPIMFNMFHGQFVDNYMFLSILWPLRCLMEPCVR